MWAALYLSGLLCVANGNSVAARDPHRFWWALLAYPIVAPINIVNFCLSRM